MNKWKITQFEKSFYLVLTLLFERNVKITLVIRVDYLGLIVPGLFLAILGVLNQIEGHEKL